MAAAQPLKVVALCGSLRKASYNRGLIRAGTLRSLPLNYGHIPLRLTTEICNQSIKDVQIEYVDISPLPFLNTDLEVEGTFPPLVEAFRQKILQADSVFFASPENNYSVSAPLKNALDWASRPPNVWADKAAAIVTAGGGGARAQYHLRQIGVFLDLHCINKPEFFLNAFQPPQKFDSDGNLIDADSKERLKQLLLSLRAFTLRLQGNAE